MKGYSIQVNSNIKSSVLLGEFGPLVQPLAGGDVPHAGLRKTSRPSASIRETAEIIYMISPLTSMISSKASVTVSREDKANVSLS